MMSREDWSEGNEELLRSLERDHAVLIVRVDHHDDRLTDMIDEQKWLRRLIVASLFTIVMTLVATVLGIVVV